MIRQAVESIRMTNTTSIPPFAKSVPPPPPLIILLRNTDFILEPLRTLLAFEDLPLKRTNYSESNHSSACSLRIRLLKIFLLTISEKTGQTLAESSAITAAMNGKMYTIDNWSPQALSSASSSPRATSMNNASPSRLSSATPNSTVVCVSKIRKPRPKGAGRYNLADIVEVETGLLEKIKVRFYFLPVLRFADFQQYFTLPHTFRADPSIPSGSEQIPSGVVGFRANSDLIPTSFRAKNSNSDF
jgi:hypothetical protein